MSKYLFVSLVTATLLCAGDRVELVATQVDANGSIINSTTYPTIIYQDQILSAQKLSYDNNSSIIEATGSVNAFKGSGQYHALSEYSRINLKEDTRYSKPYYAFDANSSAWISTSEAMGCQSKIDLSSGMLSGCDSVDPLWKIHFTSADYDTNNMWVNVYNATLYIDDVPVVYSPYFGYPTDHTRRSGLLIPSFALSNSEGISYEQPIYWAPTNWFDAEFRPQIRTSRGGGMYSDFRFVDSPTSGGSIRFGYFQEQSDYAQKYDLAHDKHYGFDLNYHHDDILKNWFGIDAVGESGLYLSGSWMNDVDYLNLLQSDETKNVTTNQILSRINGYYSSENNYFGTYFKHYQYLDQTDNAQTIQTLPSLQYHRYLETFFNNHLLANGDITATNFYRPDGKRAVQTDMNVPVKLQTALFDDYVDLSYTANTTAHAISFYGNTRTGENENLYPSGYYTQLDHIFSVGSMLVKNYDENMTHVIAPNISYSKSGARDYHGYYDKYHGQCDATNSNYAGYPCEFYGLNEPTDFLSLGVNNYWYDHQKQWLVDRLSQTFSYDDIRSYYGELQNELEWEISSAISYYNQTAYNHDRDRVTKEQNTIRYNDGVVKGSLGHYYTDTLLNSYPQYASYWNADLEYKYNRHYKIFGLVAYDYHEDVLKHSEIGFLYTQRCFDFGLRYVQNRRPILTNISGSDSVNDSYVFITLILKPIGGSEFNYKLTRN
ncbi:MAG: LPS assembly protein LptD [Sulfuricurvum sp.]|uniref:LPS-assembly protein LptD n=1 Tax=Sulfuricurvum sp. TaxID=2025608 RepID=UPI002633F69E|nr:LPS assembly protein LptD [Sulfuricurvum sp.]MDD2828292.1 LPS assembly protein LptD [Sulfuricurvum sp.]MDD4949753.1 LPS assembly protein LptD [Sulfuricurvum sp.]